MNKQEVIKILTESNQWRRGEVKDYPYSPETIGEAIDAAIEILQQSQVPSDKVSHEAVNNSKFKIDKKQDFGGEYQVINTGVDDAMTQPHLSDEEIGKLAIDTGIWQDSEEYYSFIAGYKANPHHRPNEWVRVEDSKSK